MSKLLGRHYVLALLVLVYTTNYLDRTVLQSVIEPIKHEFELSDSALGLLGGITFALFYGTLGLPIAMLADRFNRRNIIAISCAIWSVMTVLSGLAGSFWQLAAARVGVGIGEAGGTPPAHSMLADLYPMKERGRAMGIYAMGIPIGVLFGFLLGGNIAAHYGWRASFLVVGVPGLILALLLRFTLAEPARGGADEMAAARAPSFGEALGQFMARPSMIHLTIASTIATFTGNAGIYWTGSFLARTHHMGLIERSTYLALVLGICGVLGNLMAGTLIDRLSRRDVRWAVWVPAIGYIIVIPVTVVALLTDNRDLCLFLMPIAFLVPTLYLVSLWTLTTGLVGSRTRAFASALLLLILTLIGIGGGPSVAGALSDWLKPSFGDDSLRYALLLGPVLAVWMVIHFFLAGKTLAQDLEETRKAEAASCN
jgi:predicted MFS family arabinose efflux permease